MDIKVRVPRYGGYDYRTVSLDVEPMVREEIVDLAMSFEGFPDDAPDTTEIDWEETVKLLVDEHL